MDALQKAACRTRNLVIALRVSLLVGTVLNILNQGERLLGGAPSWFNVLCNYLVPFCVSAYSAARSEMRSGRGDS
ncbi:MAG: nitrate/nitrite transporter NrtS [Rhodocyclaceae bacterium]|jgi:hypothetical protein|nr:nitrate/nitrite transporter NrtS [Rhodocyclaceae bacterium]MCC6880465.1 nitrate/nitrite transporter NrtS [Rhodocyclaceae bacterium]